MLERKMLWKEQEDEIEYPVSWDPKVKFPFVALSVLGVAGYKVLTQRERHFFASYELFGIAPIGDRLGKNDQAEADGIQQRD